MKFFILLLLSSNLIFAQNSSNHISLMDRLMNNYVLCDESVKESMAALYEERDIERYNAEYDKFVACSKKADRKVLSKVLSGDLSCEKASLRLLKLGLTCQTSTNVEECHITFVRICNTYLSENPKP